MVDNGPRQEAIQDVLREAAEICKDRGAIYRDSHERLATTLVGLFPEGVALRTMRDFARFSLLVSYVQKLTRYAVQWENGHKDSIQDAIVYLAMLAVWDKET